MKIEELRNLTRKNKGTVIPDFIWKAHGLPIPEREHYFAPPREWRLDFAWVLNQHRMLRVAVEIEGGSWSKGRHVRGAGYTGDMEKYNTAAELGWKVLRYAPGKIDWEQLRRVLT